VTDPEPRPRPPNAAPLGNLAIERRGLPHSPIARLASDAYHWLRGLTWTRLFGTFFLAYLVLNVVFALILWAGDANIINAGDGFWDRFFFSVQTMATVGYGYMAPTGWFAEAVVTFESFIGVAFTAVITGVFFGKFSTPSAKVLFSRVAVISDEEGMPTLMFRAANARTTAIVEANVRVAIARDEVLPNGERVRRIHDLALRRSTSPMFALSWTVFHPIDTYSALFGKTPEELAADATTIIITLTGIDDSLAATVHTRYTYDWTQIVWGARFVDILGRDDQNRRWIDYARFHDTVPAHVTLPPP